MNENELFLHTNPLVSVEVGCARYGHHRKWHGRNTLPYNRIFLITHVPEGERAWIKNYSEGENYTYFALEEGSVYFMPKNVDLEFSFCQELGIIAFHFTLEITRGYDLFEGCTTCDRRDDMDEIIKNVAFLMETTPNIGTLIQLRGYLFQLAGIFSDRTIKELQHMYDIREKYNALFDYISTNVSASTRVSELAKYVRTSPDLLSKNFKRDIGMPIKTYLNSQIIQRACAMLTFTTKRARSIAEELCFNNEYYFSRFFKKQTGFTPIEYRKLMMKL